MEALTVAGAQTPRGRPRRLRRTAALRDALGETTLRAAQLVRHVGELTDQQEAGTPTPRATSDAPGNFIEVMSRGIVGMRFTIERLEGKAKMSQNREIPDREGVVAGLKQRGSEADAKVAGLVASEAEKAQNG